MKKFWKYNSLFFALYHLFLVIMAIFDIFDEVTEKNVVKSESGDPRIFGILVGEVTNNFSLSMPGRVCVAIHVRDTMQNVLKWARVAQPSSGSDWGQYFLPEVGDQVLVVFDQGIIDKPYVIGCIPKDRDRFLRQAKHPNNIYKMIQTRHGSTILFTDGLNVPVDGVPEEGLNDKISIYTPFKQHEITLDNEKHKITLTDLEGNARIEMNTLDGKIAINALTKLSINVGENISVVMNALTGNVTVKANNITMESTGKMLLKGAGKATLTGATMDIRSSGATKVSSAGIVSISGKPIKLG